MMYYFQGTMARYQEANVIEQSMEINKAHDKLAHMGETILRKTMQNYGMKLTGKLLPCNACMRVKA